MFKALRKITGWMLVAIVMAGVFGVCAKNVNAIGRALTVSPMNQSIVLMPGDSYDASFTISNPSDSEGSTFYELSVEPFYLNDKSEAVYETVGNTNEIVNWVSFISPIEGELKPNQVEEVKFSIDVPETAPAGGQYASILVTMKDKSPREEKNNGSSGEDASAMIKEIQRVGHLIYAEVAGDTIRKGEISDASVPGFLLGGNIKGVSSVKNVGNVHGTAKYKLQVFPLFNDEEIYTNEENPERQIIFPDRTVYNETIWEETPNIGIFNVVYTVEFEGITTEVSKMVIICPIWLLFIIIFVIIAIIIWIVMRIRARNKSDNAKRKAEMEK